MPVPTIPPTTTDSICWVFYQRDPVTSRCRSLNCFYFLLSLEVIHIKKTRLNGTVPRDTGGGHRRYPLPLIYTPPYVAMLHTCTPTRRLTFLGGRVALVANKPSGCPRPLPPFLFIPVHGPSTTHARTHTVYRSSAQPTTNKTTYLA